MYAPANLRDSFGGKKGLLRHLGARAWLHVSGLAEWKNVEWARVQRLVFVCKGNICRSPFGEAVAKSLGMESLSCGLDAEGGGPAHAKAVVSALQMGDVLGEQLKSHVSRAWQSVDLLPGDLVVCFEVHHAQAVRDRVRQAGAQCTLAGLFSTPLRPHIEDPYSASQQYFEHCFGVIRSGVEEIVRRMHCARHPVLVVQAETMGAVAVIRSLGRAGYPVHAASSDAGALGFRSSFKAKAALSPPTTDPTYPDWLSSYVSEHGISVIVPSEGLLLAIRPQFSKFARYLPYSDDAKVVYAGMSKFDLFDRALSGAPSQLSRNIPPTLRVDLETATAVDLTAQLSSMEQPFFIKTDGVYSIANRSGGVVRAESREVAVSALMELKRENRRALVQSFVPGHGVGACFVIWGGVVVGESMHRRLHEVPHAGGISSFRCTIRNDAIRTDALARLQDLGWQGPAMMEYRWEPGSGRYYLMEMNGRFWGSLHLSLFAEADLPRQLVDAFTNSPVQLPASFRDGVECRLTFPAEVQHCWSVIKDRDISLGRKCGSVGRFFWLMLDPRVKSDLWFTQDRRLYWIALGRSISTAFQGVLSRASGSRSDG